LAAVKRSFSEVDFMLRSVPIIFTLLSLSVPCTGLASVERYTGTMEVVSASGKACGGAIGPHPVELLLRRDDASSAISGYFEGQELTTGRFAGSDPSMLPVRYPYQDEFRAAGHFISIHVDGSVLRGELRDRHVDAGVEDCNFDLARLTLTRVDDTITADARLKRITALYDAQLKRSEALVLSRQGHQELSLPLYEEALSLVDSVGERNPGFLVPFITGLANGYVRAGRFKDFDRLYDERIDGLADKHVRDLFAGYRVSSLMAEGRACLGREDNAAALEKFRQAYRLNPRGRDVIAAVMAAQVRAGGYDGAITFLEEALKPLENENDRRDVRAAIAIVLYQKAKRDDKEGRGREAEESLKKAITLAPGNAQYLVALARQRHKAGSLAEAESLLRKGLERFDDEQSRLEINAALDRMRLTESILRKINRAGS
jgi:tetratricopeptide (TPR) repeat protein